MYRLIYNLYDPCEPPDMEDVFIVMLMDYVNCKPSCSIPYVFPLLNNCSTVPKPFYQKSVLSAYEGCSSYDRLYEIIHLDTSRLS